MSLFVFLVLILKKSPLFRCLAPPTILAVKALSCLIAFNDYLREVNNKLLYWDNC